MGRKKPNRSANWRVRPLPPLSPKIKIFGGPKYNYQLNMKDTRYIQLLIAALVVVMGMILLYIGVSMDPKGEIHETVLVAFGEAATFAGSIMGIEYHYRNKYKGD